MADRPGGREPGGSEATDRTLGELVAEAGGNITRLVRLELRLAKLEAMQDARRVGKGSAGLLGAGVLLHMFLILLSVTIGLALMETGLAPWAAFGIVTLFYLLLALVLVLFGVLNFRRMQGLRRTSESVSRTMAVLRREEAPGTGAEVDQHTGSSGSTVASGR